MTRMLIKAEAPEGVSIEEAAGAAIALARRTGADVSFEFDGATLTAGEDADQGEMLRVYRRVLDARHIAELEAGGRGRRGGEPEAPLPTADEIVALLRARLPDPVTIRSAKNQRGGGAVDFGWAGRLLWARAMRDVDGGPTINVFENEASEYNRTTLAVVISNLLNLKGD